jgi:predicted nucleotidyltransferase
MPKREVYEFNREKEREHQAKLRLDGVSDTKTRNEISFDKEKCKIELLSTFG